MGSSPPLDARDLAVRLETLGISDQVAREEYGFADTWEMARRRFQETVKASRQDGQVIEKFSPLKSYFHGLLMALPLAVCGAAMLLFRFSLWGGPLQAEVATAVGLGTVFGFVLSGGFVQAMARQGVFYLGTRRRQKCAEATWRWFRWGAWTAAAFAALALAWNAYFQWLPARLLAVAAAFQIALALLWLAFGMLHTHEKYLWMTGVTACGVAVVLAAHLAGAPLLISQLAGITLAVVLGVVVTHRHLEKLRQSDRAVPQRTPARRLVYLLWPYFLYGCLYYLFLWVDRLLAWTAGTRHARLPVEFRSSYEAGLDVALLAFVLQTGWVPAATQRFFRQVGALQRRFRLSERKDFSSAVSSAYRRYTGALTGALLAVSAIVWAIAHGLGFPKDPITAWAFYWALGAYPLVLVGLWNASLLFALSRPMAIVKAVIAACLVNLSVGYVLSRIGGHQHAVLGLALGAVVFAATSSYGAARSFGESDNFCFTSA